MKSKVYIIEYVLNNKIESNKKIKEYENGKRLTNTSNVDVSLFINLVVYYFQTWICTI